MKTNQSLYNYALSLSIAATAKNEAEKRKLILMVLADVKKRSC